MLLFVGSSLRFIYTCCFFSVRFVTRTKLDTIHSLTYKNNDKCLRWNNFCHRMTDCIQIFQCFKSRISSKCQKLHDVCDGGCSVTINTTAAVAVAVDCRWCCCCWFSSWCYYCCQSKYCIAVPPFSVTLVLHHSPVWVLLNVTIHMHTHWTGCSVVLEKLWYVI